MPRKLLGFLFDIVDYCGIVQEFTQSIDFAKYKEDIKTRLAVERAITIGEALLRADRLHHETRMQLPAFPKVIAFRNVLVHDYRMIEDEEVWDIIRNFVPALKTQTEQWLAILEASADKMPALAINEAQQLRNQNFNNIAIYNRRDFLRILVMFNDADSAKAALPKVQKYRQTAYVINITKWCQHPEPEPALEGFPVYKCK